MLKASKWIGCCYVISILLINAYAGLIQLPTTVTENESIQPRNAAGAVVFPFLTGFLFFSIFTLRRSATKAISKTLSAGRKKTSLQLIPFVEKRLLRIPPKMVITVILFAFTISTAFGLTLIFTENLPMDGQFYLLMLQSGLLWCCALFILLQSRNTYATINKYLSRYMRLQLFEVERLSYLNNFTISLATVVCISMGIYSMSSIYIPLKINDIIAMLVVLACVITVSLLPAAKLLRTLRVERDHELECINAKIKECIQIRQSARKKRLVDDPESVNYVSDLLTVRHNVANSPLMPIQLPAFVQLLTLFSIPLLSWLGAGLVSQMLRAVGT